MKELVKENGVIWGRSRGICGEKWVGGWYDMVVGKMV